MRGWKQVILSACVCGAPFLASVSTSDQYVRKYTIFTIREATITLVLYKQFFRTNNGVVSAQKKVLLRVLLYSCCTLETQRTYIFRVSLTFLFAGRGQVIFLCPVSFPPKVLKRVFLVQFLVHARYSERVPQGTPCFEFSMAVSVGAGRGTRRLQQQTIHIPGTGMRKVLLLSSFVANGISSDQCLYLFEVI